MTTCRECGHNGAPTAQFCTRCGAATGQPATTPGYHLMPAAPPATQFVPPVQFQRPAPFAPPPPPTGGGSHRVLIGLVTGGVVAVAVIATATLIGASTNTGDPTAAPVYNPPGEVTVYQTAEVPTVPGQTSEPTPTPTTEPADPTDALAELQRQRDADHLDVEALVDQWVPQLSAKRPGLVANGITYDYVEILRDFRATQARYPDALLLFSGDYSSFRYGDFWITVVPRPQLDGTSTNIWCDTEGIPIDDCYAKMISHTQGYEAATELR